MVATCTASLRLEKTTNKNMHSRGNTATYHYYANVPLLCGIAAFLCVFCAALPQMFSLLPLLYCRKCVRGIAAFSRQCRKCFFSRHFRGIAAFVLDVFFCFFWSKFFVALVSLIAKISTT